MTSVEVRSKSGAVETVTQESFPSWKRRAGKHVGFVVQLPGADDDDTRGVLVCTLSEMRGLPNGQHYQARLVQRCAVTDPSLKKQLRGSDVCKDA